MRGLCYKELSSDRHVCIKGQNFYQNIHSCKMVLVIEEIARFLDCSVRSLAGHLDNPQTRVCVLTKFLDRKVRTTYLNKDSERKTFRFGGITQKGANRIRAYGRLRRPYNISIAQHFYTRHRIQLKNPYLNCVIEHRPWAKDQFYPIELLEFVDDEIEKIPSLSLEFSDKAKFSPPDSPEIFMDKEFEDEMEIYRGDLSQDEW